jgi:hypothetical protein
MLISRVRSRAIRRPRGMAVLLVLGLLAVTLAVSYATLRGQASAGQLARNNGRAMDARLAAESGMASALHKISQNSWAGVDVPLSANLTDDSWYEVEFSTGDSQLDPGDSDYHQLPFRLTITSTGYAADPADPNLRSMHRVKSVVELARRRLYPSPAQWTTLTNSTIYQWGNRNTFVQVPVRVNGRATILGKLHLCAEYPSHLIGRDQYMSDLEAMRQAGLPDYRPFSGPLYVAQSRQDGLLATLLSLLGLGSSDCTDSTNPPFTHPGNVTSYRLYPGGKAYAPPIIQNVYGASISNLTLGPDPLTNPLGVFRSSGSLAIYDNVRIMGTLITDSSSPNVQIYGKNVVLEAANLPNLEGSGQLTQLPVALVQDDLRVHSLSDVQIRGSVVVWDEFELRRGAQTTKFKMTGSLLTAGMLLRGRENWVMDLLQWQNHYDFFLLQSLNVLNPNRIRYFPEYMEKNVGLIMQPTLTFQGDSSGVSRHWHDWSQPLFQADPSDPGLRWNLVRYEDGV